jgi:hypothetical protein
MIAAPLSNAVYKVTGNTSGCKGDTATVIISVHPLPVITTSADSQHICAGDTATLSAYGAQSYVWSPTTGLNTTLGSVVTASPASDMTYTVIGTDSNSCSAPSVPLHVIVSTAQQPIISAVDSALSSSAASSYQWYLNGVALPSDTSRDLIATASGVYQVLIYNPQGCSAISDTLRFTLSPSGIPDITSTKAFTIYPNPVNGECHIVSSSLVAKNSFVMIHDLTGRIVKTIPLSGIDTAFQTDEMSAGMYICSIVSAGKVMSSQKLIVQ